MNLILSTRNGYTHIVITVNDKPAMGYITKDDVRAAAWIQRSLRKINNRI